MVAHDNKQREFDDRLVAALAKAEVFTRRDEQNRIFASDGEYEYEVAVTGDEGDTNYGRRGGPKLVIGQRTLRGLESGANGLFWWGLTRPPQPQEPADEPAPASPHYQPLEWTGDESDVRELEIEAQSDDWTYRISSVPGEDGEFIGYDVHGGDIEESEDLGLFESDGEPAEDALEDAKSAAQTNYAARYVEVEQMLFDIVSQYRDDDGNALARYDSRGRIFCHVEELRYEIEIAATLRDYGDEFDIAERCWTVCLRSILVYLDSGDWLEGMYSDMRNAGVSIPDDSQ